MVVKVLHLSAYSDMPSASLSLRNTREH